MPPPPAASASSGLPAPRRCSGPAARRSSRAWKSQRKTGDHPGPPHGDRDDLSKHPNECLTCGRNQNCELQTIAADFGLRDVTLESNRSGSTAGRHHSRRHSGPSQVHLMRPLHPGLPADSGRLGAEFPGSRHRHSHRPAGDITLADRPASRCGPVLGPFGPDRRNRR